MPSDPLVNAVKNRDVNVVKRLLEEGHDPNASDSEGRSALDWAVIRSNLEFVRVLLDKGADVNRRGKGGKTAIHWAVRYALDERILTHLRGFNADLEVTNDATDNVLHAAAYYGNAIGIDFCLNQGLSLSTITSKYGYTPLLRAARGFADESILDHLVRRGADVTVKRTGDGQNFLHCAAKGLNEEAIKWGLKMGISADDVSDIGTTPIQHMERWAEIKSQRDKEAFKNIKLILETASHIDVGAIRVESGGTPWREESLEEDLDGRTASALEEMQKCLRDLKEIHGLSDAEEGRLLKCLVERSNQGRKFTYDVFISHAWKGKSGPVSRSVKEILEKENLRVWYDEENIQGDLNKAMVDGISNSATFLLVSSQEYEESMNCMREMNYADRKKKPIVHVSTGYRTTGELDFVIGNLLYYEIPRDKENLLKKVREEISKANNNNNNSSGVRPSP